MRVLLFVWLSAALVAAAPLSDTARILARRIAATLGVRETVAISVRNISSLSEAEAAEVRAALESELRASGISIAPNAAVKVAMTLSENLQDSVFAAEIVRGDKRDVMLATRPRTAASLAMAPATHAAIEKKLLWEQADPILDAALAGGDLLLLEPSRIWIYLRRGDHWEPGRPIPIPQTEPLPRDPRGRLQIQGDSFRAYLPGTACFGAVRPEFSADCGESDAKWPVAAEMAAALVAGRNLFTGRAGQFYSAAGAAPFSIFAAADGRARLYDQASAPAGSFDGWGSDIAAVRSNCGSRRQVLVTKASDCRPSMDRATRSTPGILPAFSRPATGAWTTSGSRTHRQECLCYGRNHELADQAAVVLHADGHGDRGSGDLDRFSRCAPGIRTGG